MIQIQNVHKSFGSLEVLKGVTMDVNKGEVVSVIGGSGSGKSTLLYCINAIEDIQQGRIIVDEIDVHAKGTNQDRLRQKLGMVFQQWNSFPHLTVLENASLAPRIVLKLSKKEACAHLRWPGRAFVGGSSCAIRAETKPNTDGVES